MVTGNFYHNFLGWDYAIWLAGGLVLIWFIFQSFLEDKSKNKSPKKKILLRSILIVFALHFAFVGLINPFFFGFGSPNSIKEAAFSEDYIYFFDTESTFLGSDNELLDRDIVQHSRIHVVDRKSHTFLYSERLGTNSTYRIIEGNIVFIENSTRQNSEMYNTVVSASIFDPVSREKKLLAKESGLIDVNGQQVKVYEIVVYKSIIVYDVNANVYYFDLKENKFKNWLEKEVEKEIENQLDFRMQPSEYAPDTDELTYKHAYTNQFFIAARKYFEFSVDGVEYCLVDAFSDLSKKDEELSLLNQFGELIWMKKLSYFEEVSSSNLKQIDLIAFDSGYCYITCGSYVFECSFEDGSVNWWLKL